MRNLDSSVLFERGLFRARIIIKESNLLLVSDISAAIQAATRSILNNRTLLETYVAGNPAFMCALEPFEIDESAPLVAIRASDAATAAGVGPFAAIPGALADLAVEEMSRCGASVCLVENGGEISGNSGVPLNVGIYAGVSKVSGRIGFRLRANDFPIGISTSSATVSHAITFGEADAAVTVADTAALSDASATAVCNAVAGKDVEASVQAGLEAAEEMPHLRGALVARGQFVGSVGRLPKLLNLKGDVDEMLEASLHGIAAQPALVL